MHCQLRIVLVFALAAVLPVQAQAYRQPLLALCYHDVVQRYEDTLADPSAVTVDTLVSHLSWLHAQGFETVSLAQWQAGQDIPDKPLLLTFDDGFSSFQRYVLPLLEMFGYRAVLAPVTGWIDAPAGQPVAYGETARPRDDFLTWDALREIHASGLVDIASHTHALHRGIIANAEGSFTPAAATHAWQPQRHAYESTAAYRARLLTDLRRSAARLTEELSAIPQAIAWPYGAYNEEANALASELGLAQVLTLDGAANVPGSRVLHRRLVSYKSDLGHIRHAVAYPDDQPPLRATLVRLDDIYHPDAGQMERRLDALLERIRAMKITAVFLQAVGDADGNGIADSAYFDNRTLPVRADLFGRVAWQLKTRAEVQVYAWLPVARLELADERAHRWLAAADYGEGFRLDVRYQEVRGLVAALYDDLGRRSRVDGLLFHGEVDARQTYTEFTQELAGRVRHWQGALKVVRSADVANGASLLDHYDYVALQADGDDLEEAMRVFSSGGLLAQRKLAVLLPAGLSERVLSGAFDRLLRAGVRHIAYGPDRPNDGCPNAGLVRRHLSNNWFPAFKR